MYLITEISTSKKYFLKSISDSMGGTFTLNRQEAKEYSTKYEAGLDIAKHQNTIPNSAMNRFNIEPA